MSRRCLLDLDGVLVDFVGGMCRAHRRPNPYDHESSHGNYEMADLWGISANRFWEPADASFWFGLEMLPDAMEILAACTGGFGAENVCLLTSPSLNEGATDGKVRWIYKHLPEFKRRFLIGAAKEFCADYGSLLVDDCDKNAAKFLDAGGHSLLVPRPWNSFYRASYRTAEVVKEGVEEFLRMPVKCNN